MLVKNGQYNRDYSPTELLGMSRVPPSREDGPVSIGMALAYLSSVSKIGDEFQGGCDGLDALCYHLGLGTVDNAIEALQKVKQRFNDYEKK